MESFSKRARQHWNSLSHEERVLRYAQPAILGLCDGLLASTGPLLAAAYFAGSKAALIIGLSAAISAAISMGLSEALSDSEGSGSGRGSPLNRGLITGGATLIGGIVHVLPFLISDVKTALLVAYIVLAVELLAVAWIRQHFLRVSLWRSIIQIVLGGIIIAAVGITLGSQG